MDPGPPDRPPFPVDVRARLDPALFRCDRCDDDLAYPGQYCHTCRQELSRERRPARQRQRRHGFNVKPDGGGLIPRSDLEEFRRIFQLPASRYISMPDFRLDPCAYCGAPGPNTLDHIEPYADVRRSNLWSNATACCESCNFTKLSLSLFDFLARRHRLPVRQPGGRAKRRSKAVARMWKRHRLRLARLGEDAL